MFVYWNDNTFEIKDQSEYVFFDRGFQFGDGVYETIAVKKGKPVFIIDHLNRLFDDSRRIDLQVKQTLLQWTEKIEELIQKNEIKEGFVKIIITRGSAGNCGLSYMELENTSVFITAQNCHFQQLKEKKPYRVLISQLERRNPNSVVTYTKTLNYLSNIIARNEADIKECDEAILVNVEGNICEGTTSNIFFVDDDLKISTPEVKSGLLNGIVRTKVIKAAVELGIEVVEEVLSPEKFKTTKGCFLTSSLLDITPVKELYNEVHYRYADYENVLERIDERYRSYIDYGHL